MMGADEEKCIMYKRIMFIANFSLWSPWVPSNHLYSIVSWNKVCSFLKRIIKKCTIADIQ
jgi:hypothetical protein